MKTYYDLFQVKEDASVDEIRAAFRRLAKRFHPDVNKEPEAAQAMKIITEAYEVLSDPKLRALYDQKLARLRAPKQPQIVRIVMPMGGFGFTQFGGMRTSSNTSTTMDSGTTFHFDVG